MINARTDVVGSLLCPSWLIGAREDVAAARIKEAARVIPLERLAISPQCGFATSIGGNAITVEDERRKRAILAETARAVWGA